MVTGRSSVTQLLTVISLGVGNLFAAPTQTNTTQDNTTQDRSLEESSAVAQKWISLLDSAKYDVSWDEASERLKKVFPKLSWNSYLKTVRGPLGDVKNRTLAEQRQALNPKGLTPGQYMVILFNTDFSKETNKQEPMQELITMGLEKGQWRVLSYHVTAR